MATAETNNVIDSDAMTELRQAAARAGRGVRDPEAMRRACDRMDQLREENRAKFGEADIGVQIIREFREAQ